MAFFIVCMQLEYTWYIDQEKPKLDISHREALPPVSYLMANDDELELIRVRFKNIPIVVGNLCVWRGWYAQFIYDNL